MNPAYLKQIRQRLSEVHQRLNDEAPHVGELPALQVGIDLGTADIQTVVVDGQGRVLAAFLDWANVVKDGVVVDYFSACQIVKSQMAKAEAKLGVQFTQAVTSYPPGTDARLSINVIESAGIEITNVVDEPTSVAHLLQIEEGAVVDVGGGTTGTAIIQDSKCLQSYDDPCGGHHVSLTLAGGLKISLEEAEQFKRAPDSQKMVATMVRPVVEKMASLVEQHLNGQVPSSLYLTGGGCLIAGFETVFAEFFPKCQIVGFKHALYLTPYAIAAYQFADLHAVS